MSWWKIVPAIPLVLLLTGSLEAQFDDVKYPALLTAKPLSPSASDDELRKLLKERYNAALGEMKELYKLSLTGRVHYDHLFDGANRLVRAGLEVHEKSADQIILLTEFVALTKEIEKQTREKFEAGRVNEYDVGYCRYMRADAEIQLLRAKQKLNPPSKE